PRALPTDDVLILRDKKGEQVSAKKPPVAPPAVPWKGPLTLDVVEGVPKMNGHIAVGTRGRGAPPRTGAIQPAAEDETAATEGRVAEGFVLVLSTLDEVRAVAERSTDLSAVRAVVAPF